MPIFGTEYVLSNAAQAGNIALANNDYIKGSFKEYATAAHLSYSSSNFPDRFKTGQIVYVSQSNQLFRISIVYDEINEINVLTTQSFQFPGGSTPSGTISGSPQIAELGYLTSASAAAAGFGSGGGTTTDISALNTFTGSAQTSLSALNSATSSYALKTEISGAFTSVSSSISTRLTSLETGGVSVPAGTISGSQQITDLGFINQSQTSSMSVLSALTASFISSTFISASAAASGFGTATLPSGVLSSSAQIATNISGAFTEVSGGLAGRITTLEGTIGGDVTESIVTSVVTNNGSSYYIIDDIEKPKLSFAPGITYRFNLSGIVGSHPFKFSTSPNGPTQYTTGVTSGSGFIQIETGYNTTSPLYYYCTNHSGMGNEINVLQIEKLITNSQTSSMSVLSALTASFISDIFISASAAASGFGTALFPSGLLSSSFQIATDISGAFTSLSSSFASRITTLEGAGGGNGIFTLTGSFYSTTNNIQITGSLSVGSGSFKAFEIDSDGFIILGNMDKDLNNAPEGTISYSGSNFYLIF